MERETTDKFAWTANTEAFGWVLYGYVPGRGGGGRGAALGAGRGHRGTATSHPTRSRACFYIPPGERHICDLALLYVPTSYVLHDTEFLP